MTAAWHKPKTLGLTEKLLQVNARLQEIIPKIMEAQAQAVKRMAETAVAAQGKSIQEKPSE